MDTGTHFAMGIGLFGLAHLDPAVTAHPVTAQAVLFGNRARLPGSGFRRAVPLQGRRGLYPQSPGLQPFHSDDFRLDPPSSSSSFPSPMGSFPFPALDVDVLAVSVHVLIDCFNSYGTQALRPFSHRWIAWDVLNIIDPFILIAHLAGFLLWWMTPIQPGILFAGIDSLIILHILWRWRFTEPWCGG